MCIDIQQYKCTWIVGGTPAVPQELDLTSSAAGKWEDEPHKLVDLDAMHYAGTALGKAELPPKECFVVGKAMHVHHDGGFQKGHAKGNFVILDVDCVEIILYVDIVEIIWAGWYFNAG